MPVGDYIGDLIPALLGDGVPAGGGVDFDPVEHLGALVQEWWDFSDAASITIGTGISRVAGQLGVSDLVQSTGASQPAAGAGLDGRACADFDGAAHWMQTETAFPVSSTDRWSIFAIAKSDDLTTAATQIMLSFEDTAGSARLQLQSPRASDDLDRHYTNPWQVHTSHTTEWDIYSINLSTEYGRVTHGSASLPSDHNSSAIGGGGLDSHLFVGDYSPGGLHWNGKIIAIVLCKGDVTQAMIDANERAINAWLPSLGHFPSDTWPLDRIRGAEEQGSVLGAGGEYAMATVHVGANDWRGLYKSEEFTPADEVRPITSSDGRVWTKGATPFSTPRRSAKLFFDSSSGRYHGYLRSDGAAVHYAYSDNWSAWTEDPTDPLETADFGWSVTSIAVSDMVQVGGQWWFFGYWRGPSSAGGTWYSIGTGWTDLDSVQAPTKVSISGDADDSPGGWRGWASVVRHGGRWYMLYGAENAAGTLIELRWATSTASTPTGWTLVGPAVDPVLGAPNTADNWQKEGSFQPNILKENADPFQAPREVDGKLWISYSGRSGNASRSGVATTMHHAL